MNTDTATTITGLLKAITTATATVHLAQDSMSYWLGLVLSVLLAAQGYLTNK